MTKAEAVALVHKMRAERVQVHRELDMVLRGMKLTKANELPADVAAVIRKFAAFEAEYARLKQAAGVVKFVCSECDYESDEPAAECPECGTHMAVENDAPPVALNGAPARVDEDQLDVYGNKVHRRTGGRLDGKRLTDTKKRRVRLI